MSIRSGRFTFPNNTTAGNHDFVILNNMAKGSVFYRVFNSGNQNFNVSVRKPNDDLVTGTDTPILPGDSADFVLDDEQKLRATWTAPTGAVNLEGIYSFLGDNDSNSLEDVRSGRLRGTPGTTGLKFVNFAADSKAAAVFRVFNSSKSEDIQIYSNGTLVTAVSPRFSIDLGPNQKGGDLTVKAAAGKEIEMIYEFLAGAIKS
jgi:hypothetical protein